MQFEVPTLPVRSHSHDAEAIRWPLLFFYINCLLCVSALGLCFSPVSEALAAGYHVDILQVNMCDLIYSITFIPMTFISIWLFRTIPADWVLRIANLIMFAGCWMRIISFFDDQWWSILYGGTLLSCSMPLYVSYMT